MRILIVLALALVACKQGDGAPPASGSDHPGAASGDATCEAVADHFADYLTPGRTSEFWPEARKNALQLCTGNAFTAEERACWMAIHDMKSHQACLDLREKLGKPPLRDPGLEEAKEPEEEPAVEDEAAEPADDKAPREED